MYIIVTWGSCHLLALPVVSNVPIYILSGKVSCLGLSIHWPKEAWNLQYTCFSSLTITIVQTFSQNNFPKLSHTLPSLCLLHKDVLKNVFKQNSGVISKFLNKRSKQFCCIISIQMSQITLIFKGGPVLWTLEYCIDSVETSFPNSCLWVDEKLIINHKNIRLKNSN